MADPIDELIPPPRRWWARLLTAAIILTVVAIGSMAYGFGYVYPRPDCCADAGGSSRMSLSTDGEAVVLSVFFYNSSRRDLRITGASANLPGATVLDVGGLDETPSSTFSARTEPLPIVVGREEPARIAITFVPDRCVQEAGAWGSANVELEIAEATWPTLGRTFELPEPVVDGGPFGFHVAGPPDADVSDDDPDELTPLAAACALLGIDD